MEAGFMHELQDAKDAGLPNDSIIERMARTIPEAKIAEMISRLL
ncbi:MAG: hypothetical protein JWL72_2817 [Ilumatobacteraceae bacterium]|nr:hypothetical protein [Ilumatobacteraceae bacterium]